MNNHVVITCAVTGSGDTKDKHPDLPITPEQIAAAAISAAQAGAAVCHIHVRDPATGQGARDVELYRQVVETVRGSDTDVVINLTTGMGGDWVPDPDNPSMPGAGTDLVGPEERLAHVALLRPEICSLDCGTMNFGDDIIYISTPRMLRDMAALIKEWGVKPELEVFDLGQINVARQLVDQGLVLSPPLFQLCLGITWGAASDTLQMLTMRDALPDDAVWASFGLGRLEMAMVAQAVVLGGHVRVGLEDNLYLQKGVLASNADLVARAANIVELLGATVAGPEEARELLHLKP